MRTDRWKHFLSRGQVEISGYYKTRRNVVALRPEAFIDFPMPIPEAGNGSTT